MLLLQVVLGRWSLQDDVVVGLRSSKWPAHQAQISASAIGCLSNLLPMRAALNKSVTFCLLVNRVGEELREGQTHAMLPSLQMLEGTRAVCQASMSLAPLASQCSSGFAAKEVLRPVSMRYNTGDIKGLLALSMHIAWPVLLLQLLLVGPHAKHQLPSLSAWLSASIISSNVL